MHISPYQGHGIQEINTMDAKKMPMSIYQIWISEIERKNVKHQNISKHFKSKWQTEITKSTFWIIYSGGCILV